MLEPQDLLLGFAVALGVVGLVIAVRDVLASRRDKRWRWP